MVRIVFFGTPRFAVPTLIRLLASRHRVVAVVTQPDRPRGRGQRASATPAKQVAQDHGLPVFDPTRLRDAQFIDSLSATAPDLGVVAAYGQIIPETVLNIPRHGMINVHASLLPAYRGAAPIQRAIMAGETETGVTIMRVVPALDAGPILTRERQSIALDDTADVIERRLADVGAELLVRTIDPFLAGDIREQPQDETAATYAPRLVTADGQIDWRKPARVIHDQVRALHPSPHAFARLNGRRYLILHSATVSLDRAVDAVDAGRILDARHDRFLVAAGDGAGLAILRIQPEGRRAMSARDFLAGHDVEPGSAFDTTTAP